MSERKYVDADLLYYNAVNNMRLEKSSEWQNGYATCLKQIQDASAVDVQEVKRGEWEIYHYPHADTVQCTACKAKWGLDRFQFVIADKINNLPYYCPNCGSKMDEKENDK